MEVADALRPTTAEDDAAAPRVGPASRPAPRPWWATAALVGVGVVLLASVVLRFWTTSHLWLDEALTVDIAKLPLGKIPAALRHDGSPPLYYLLLHFWMDLFGEGTFAVRALSGVIGVATLPLAYLAGRRLGGRWVAITTLLLVASSPFAVRYSTENRVYILIVLLTLAGYLLLDAAMARPTAGLLVGIAVVTGLLLLSHYWSLYLVAAVALMLTQIALRGTPARKRAARRCLVALLAGFVFLLPWASILVFQLRHTGTPWSQPANFNAIVNAISDFAGGATNQGRALGLLFFALSGLGLFGLAVDRRHIELDLRTRPQGRSVAWVTLGTLGIAISAGMVLHSAYTTRYTAVVFAIFMMLVALGITTFTDIRIRGAVLGAATLFGLLGSLPNVHTDRTQAGVIAARLAKSASPGDVVAYCPDQLGPAVSRLLPSAGLSQLTYPRAIGPQTVDWVDYAKVNEASHPAAFAKMLMSLAGTHNIWVVWAPDYKTFEGKCTSLVTDLETMRPHNASYVAEQPARYFEHANLERLWAS